MPERLFPDSPVPLSGIWLFSADVLNVPRQSATVGYDMLRGNGLE
jgi:hypothetical protein